MDRIDQIAVIGSGIMGAGIADAVLRHGVKVKLYDIDPESLHSAVTGIRGRVRRGTDPENLTEASSPEEVLDGADLVIEAVAEDPDVKCALFRELGGLADPRTVFASNTSSLCISDMAEASGRPDRFVGLHFFNPPIIMRLVEFTVTGDVSPDTLTLVREFLERIRKTGVECLDSPGFIVNRLLIPVINETFYLVDELSGKHNESIIETANDIDSAVLKDNLLLMGPCDLADLTGIDTAWKAAQVVYKGFDRNPRYIPPSLLKHYAEEGRLGRKSGKGIYCYANKENDPDLNPPLDEKGNRILRKEHPRFRAVDLVAVMVNEAYRILEEGIARTPEDIDLCMDLGTRWPRGPFRLAKDTGPDLIYEDLARLYGETGIPRYEPSTLFREPSPALEMFLWED